jgi:hypothetical protein
MFDDPEALFYDNVLASYQAFIESLESDPHGQHHDTRLAINAATALYHYREHVVRSFQKLERLSRRLVPTTISWETSSMHQNTGRSRKARHKSLPPTRYSR